jgi:hypothetical protein
MRDESKRTGDLLGLVNTANPFSTVSGGTEKESKADTA